jgi:glucose-1-phosphate cytidylyltransferase
LKTVILAGGQGTRISEESRLKPKPLIEIGGMPVLWHIMKIYSSYGINDFVICLGYKGNMIKEYFSNYFKNVTSVALDVKNEGMKVHDNNLVSWKIIFANTGQNTMTGGRLKRIKKYVENETFCLSYGDDLKKVNIQELIKFHKNKKTLATVTVFQQPARFGIINLLNDKVQRVKEKPMDRKWVNGGYYVLEPDVFDYIKGDSTVWEHEPLERLAREGQLSAYKYRGLYQPMDTLSDKISLQDLWKKGKAYWKTW